MLLIRTDASAKVGTGHVMRCLALAQAWQSGGGRVAFLMADSSPTLETRLRSEEFEVIHHPHPLGDEQDSDYTIALAKALNAEHVVVDGYHFEAAYQRHLKSAGLRVLFVDDNGHADHYAADWVLNQNIYAHEGLYSHRSPDTQLLLGPRYALIRREFWTWRGWQRQISPIAHKVLVTLGGSDPNNVTLMVIQVLQHVKVPDLEVVVVVGGSNPHISTLQAAAQSGPVKFHLRQNVADMPKLMSWADIAIAGGGSTCWELALMGLPSLILTLADNQRAVAQALGERGIVKSLGVPFTLSLAQITQEIEELLFHDDLRANLSAAGNQISDGNGVYRVVMLLEDSRIWLRPIHQEDCQLLWHWANDPTVRSVSFSQQSIPWQEHERWFLRKLHSPNCYFYIAFDHQDQPVGQVRFDFLNPNALDAEISVSVDSQFRARGFGSLLINLGVQRLFKETLAEVIYADIKAENVTSIKSFERAGFNKESDEFKDNCLVFRYSKLRDSVAAKPN